MTDTTKEPVAVGDAVKDWCGQVVPTFQCGWPSPEILKTACRERFPLTMMFRCYDCGGAFCRKCLILHCQAKAASSQVST